MDIRLPEKVGAIIAALEKQGFEAYIVGGCVRDSILGILPKDWDICTSALPRQVAECFEGQTIIETGLRHGTVTLVVEYVSYEITTFRLDGEYSDNRHPDSVTFTDNLKHDLARRDFTINAMAYNPKRGLMDFFGGKKDLIDGKIVCVGNPCERFCEDALRIMRALRFAAKLGYCIEENTEAAIFSEKSRLKCIAVERIANEMNELIIQDSVTDILIKYKEVIAEFIPELIPTFGFPQKNKYHCFDVYRHIAESVSRAPHDVASRLAMLFHDIEKPSCYSEKNGSGHFYGHPKFSADRAVRILRRLKYDNETINAVKTLVLYHDEKIIPEKKHIKRHLNKIGEERFRNLLDIQRADTLAKSPECQREKLNLLSQIEDITNEIIAENECFSLKNLAVDGRDLIKLGICEGPVIGKMLERLMDMVLNEDVANDKEQLLRTARVIISDEK